MSDQSKKGIKKLDIKTDIPSLQGKVILVTGGTAGLGAESVKAFAAHNPEHIYFTGRNAHAADALKAEIGLHHPDASLTFLELDLSSLQSVKQAIEKGFKHSRLDILMNNAGIVAKPPTLSTDGYEIQFATNHLGHAMLTKQLLPYLIATASEPKSDVRIVNTSSDGYEMHKLISGGISFKELENKSGMGRRFFGPWQRYGQSKLANILFASEFARHYPAITSVSIHPGVVSTPMNTEMTGWNKKFVDFGVWASGSKMVEPHEGAWNQLWCAAVAKKEELRNGGFYRPVGQDATADLSGRGGDEKLASELWEWTERILDQIP